MGDFVATTPPSVGEATKASLPATMIDNDDNLNARIGTVEGGILVNGSIESAGDTTDTAAAWVFLTGAGGTITRETSVQNHGAWALSMARTASDPGNNAGSATSDIFAVGPGKFSLEMFYEASAAVESVIEAKWYREDGTTVISTTTIATITEATGFRRYYFEHEPEVDARFCELIIRGATATVDLAATVYFDGIVFKQENLEDYAGVFDDTEFSAGGSDGVWVTAGTFDVYIPEDVSTMTLIMNFKLLGATTASIKFLIGGNSSTIASTSSGTYAAKTMTATVPGGSTGQYSTVTVQHRSDTGNSTSGSQLSSSFSNGREGNILLNP